MPAGSVNNERCFSLKNVVYTPLRTRSLTLCTPPSLHEDILHHTTPSLCPDLSLAADLDMTPLAQPNPAHAARLTCVRTCLLSSRSLDLGA